MTIAEQRTDTPSRPAPSHNTRKVKGHAHSWYPYSACGKTCAAQIHDEARASGGTIAVRLAGLVRMPLFIATGAVAVALPQRVRSAMGPKIARQFLRSFGVEVVVDAPARASEALRRDGVLVAVNHHTWWDVFVLASIAPVRFIARDDLAAIPLLGAVIARMGTIFIDRASLRSLPKVVADAAETLRDGHNVVAFPEATTWCGAAHGRFRPAIFQAALDSGAPVLPVHIEYRNDRGERTAAAAFIGKDTVASSVWNILSGRCTTIHVRLYPPLRPGVNAPGHRQDLAAITHRVIFGDDGERDHG